MAKFYGRTPHSQCSPDIWQKKNCLVHQMFYSYAFSIWYKFIFFSHFKPKYLVSQM